MSVAAENVPRPDPALHMPAHRTLQRIALVALAYAVWGKLGLLLAVPPGYATAVWPASGVALAAVLLWGRSVTPGVMIGSFAVNAMTSWDASTQSLLVRSLVMPTTIACGAALQAALGAWLIRRSGFRHIFSGEHDVIRTLVIGGPLACLISASVGTGTLLLWGVLPPANVSFSWLTWWVGDSIGVMIFVPLICAWSMRPGRDWRRQQIALTVPMVVLFTAVVILFFYVSATEQRRQTAEFDEEAMEFGASLQKALDSNLQMLTAVSSFHAASRHVERQEFETFVAAMLPHYTAVQTVGWSPWVSSAERDAFVQAMRRDGEPEFDITERSASGALVPAGVRSEYTPVSFIVPEDLNGQAIGYDLLSEPVRGDAIRRAMRSRSATATGWLHPVQDPVPRPSTILYLPLYGSDPAEAPSLASAVLRIEPLLEAAFVGLSATGLHVRVSDATADSTVPPIVMGSPAPATPGAVAAERLIPIHVADHDWNVYFALTESYAVAHRSWRAWGMLAVGLSLAGLLGMLLLVLLARQSRIEEAVAQRTAELHEAQRRLEQYAAGLERSNKELEQFASVASHDLQAPVRGVISFVRLLRERYSGRTLEGKGEEFLRLIEQSAVHMKSLIDGLLALSRVGHREPGHGPVDCNDVLQEVEAQLAAIVQERDALITHDRLPVALGSRIEVFQVLQNLITNGLKFQPGHAPRIHVSAAREGAFWRISVMDRGIGIAPRHQKRIFRIFQRLNANDTYEGTGIGLAICEKIVSNHGGRIWVESTPGHGATFHFTLPAVS
ncbi:MAG: Sensor protein (histidin kinase domain) [Panacagrimonas sp.]|jgi:signal transduction histidine kinase/integral membrane sensor domain MASE1|nr:CHASE domain-containing protein [Panacagrimonas sp.]MCC2657216.1 Sensor protein (histidin kinase domain) [Panacagrimonas sp.]